MAAGAPIDQNWVCFEISDRHLASFSLWPLIQPFSGLLRHAMEGRSVRAATRLQCAKSPLRRAFEMADLAAFL
jgi:hypothetical protein